MIIGIDPGVSGGIAFLYGNGEVVAHPMPVYEKELSTRTARGTKKKRKFVEPTEVYELLVGSMASAVVIEHVSSTPRDGAVQAFSFGEAFGVVKGVAAALEVPVHLVRPQVWKAKLGLSQDKDASRALASRLFPDAAHLWKRKKDDGLAEAVLIAHYGKQFLLQ